MLEIARQTVCGFAIQIIHGEMMKRGQDIETPPMRMTINAIISTNKQIDCEMSEHFCDDKRLHQIP